jgi:Ca-activated chloride channel family protein
MNALLPPGVELAHPWALLLALVPLAALAWRQLRRERPSLRVPALAAFPRRTSWRVRLRFLPVAARVLALLLAVVALARPRERDLVERSTTEGVDIMVALDTSGSMLAEDMTSASGAQQNRFDAAKDVIADFVRRRPSDRIGLLTFDSASVPRCPPTLDTEVFLEFLDQVELDLEGGLTAIGAGLASAVNRLKDSPAKSRVIILVTDGRNTTGRIEPVDAAEIARVMGLRVYTVGVGTKGLAPYPVPGAFGRIEYRRVPADVDDETLQLIADRTNGRYFRATDRDELQGIFEDIDRLEKSVIDVQRHVRWRELFPPFAGAAAALAVLGIVGSATLWRTFP